MQALWPKLTKLKWLHSSSAGVEKLLFPELVESEVPVSNAKGVYSHSLAEYALTCCNWFAKDLPRMRRSQQQGKWDPYDVEELRGVRHRHRATHPLNNLSVHSQPLSPALCACYATCLTHPALAPGHRAWVPRM